MTWRALEKSWHDTTVDYCDVCGNLLIGRYWEFRDNDHVMRGCREDDVDLLQRLQSYRSVRLEGAQFTPFEKRSNR